MKSLWMMKQQKEKYYLQNKEKKMDITINQKGQAVAPQTRFMSVKDFEKKDTTSIYWMGNASILLNVRGTLMMIDPLLEGFDMPLLMEMPILPKNVPLLDACLITHIDNDHFSRLTCKDLKGKCKTYHAPHYVAKQMKIDCDIDGVGHDIHEKFDVNDVTVTLTPAWHNWQNESKKYNYREWKMEDYCGYWFDTPDGTIWLPGDSRLLQEHLNMPQPDVILFDFADNSWHITLDGAIRLANAYPNSDLICIHWGCVDAPEMTPFNGNPQNLIDKVIHPERIKVLAPGEEFILNKR